LRAKTEPISLCKPANLFDKRRFNGYKKLLLKPISKIADHAQEQGTGRRKSAAYIEVCEHFEEVGNTAIER
jgi:hypothetical protein